MRNSTIAIIPARGGSKRIERKNIKPFAGIPVIGYSIRAAIDSGCFDEVMVSTDDDGIASVARKFGATVRMRSAENSNDFATTADVLREVLAKYRAEGREFDIMACIYATAPFITAEKLRLGFNLLTGNASLNTDKKNLPTAAFTCVEYSYPIQRSLMLSSDGKRISMRYPEFATARSQDLEKTYHDAGQFYFTTVKAFEESGSLWGPQTAPIVLPETEVQDLDTPIDWRLAEMKYELGSLPRKTAIGNYILVPYQDLDENTSEKLRQGRNLEDIRSQMVNTDEISEESHAKFVESLALKRREKQYYAVFKAESMNQAPLGNDGLLGSLTLEFTYDSTIERGIWLFPEAQGKGHARNLLKALYRYLNEEKGIKKIVTRVRVTNNASRALESSLGAKEIFPQDPDSGFIFYETVNLR